MKIEVNIDKTRFFILFGTVLFLAGLFIVYAYNPSFNKAASQAVVFGHSADETVVKMSDGTIKTVQELLGNGVFLSSQTNCVSGSIYQCSNAGIQFANFSSSLQSFQSSCIYPRFNVSSSPVPCSCTYVSPICLPTKVCGNGVIESGEECDDGNFDSWRDLCSNDCKHNSPNKILLSGAKFKDGHTISINSIGLNPADDFRDGPDYVCQQLQGSYTKSISYYAVSEGVKVNPLAYCGMNFEHRHNGDWKSLVLGCSSTGLPSIINNPIYVWIECE